MSFRINPISANNNKAEPSKLIGSSAEEAKKPIFPAPDTQKTDDRDGFRFVETHFEKDNTIDHKTYINDDGETKCVYYFNNQEIFEENYDKNGDRRSRHSLVKDDFENFIRNNLNEENADQFLTTYGRREFLSDLFQNKNIDRETKEKIYNDVFNLLDENAKDRLTELRQNDVPDGDFEGAFSQGSKGDCVIVGRIVALLSKHRGKEALKNTTRIDDEGNIIVTFKGLGNKEVKVTYDELKNHDYSSGNADVRALEIAWNKVTKYIGGVNNPISNLTFDKALLGITSSSTELSSLEYVVPVPDLTKSLALKKHYIKEFNNPNKAYVMGLNILNIIPRFYVNPTFEDNGEKVKLQPIHQYAVVKADNDYVYMVNPYDSGRNIKIKWSDFNKLSFTLHEMRIGDT